MSKYRLDDYDLEATIEFAISIAFGGWSYLIIYGEYVNGHFCCVPQWNWGCDMSQPWDVYYNSQKLEAAGADREVARVIAEAIRDYAERGEKAE